MRKAAEVISYNGAIYRKVADTLFYKGVRYRRASLAESEKLFKAVLPGTEFAGHVFAVGGYVRDEVMGIDSKDLDVVIDVKGGAEAFAKFMHSKFPGKVSTPRQLGKGYPIWFIAFKDDVEYDGKAYKTAGGEIDIAESQKEGFPDPDSRQRVKTEPILDGNTIMKILGIKPGPGVGKAMWWLQERVDDHAAEGKELTPEEAVKLLQTEYTPA